MKQYEYKLIEAFLYKVVAELNELGEQGWQFVSFVGESYKMKGFDTERIKVFLEREKDE